MARYHGWHFSKKKPKKSIPEGTGIRGGGKFGLTWWGGKWLDAFENISDYNRLPRGRTYANNGSVREIDIRGNVVTAKVQGSYLYEVSVEAQVFSRKQQERLLELIGGNPSLLSRLVNRELPDELLELCAQEGIELFPPNWSSLKASCSCPDWALPCKHLAAVVYLLANEIDKNPFLVFSLHGLDLDAELAQAGYASGDSASSILSLVDLRQPMDKKREARRPDPGLIREIDFSTIPDCAAHLSAILTEKPVFYPSADFKAVFKKALAAVSKKQNGGNGAATSEWGEGDDLAYRRSTVLECTLDESGRPVAFGAWDDSDNAVFDTRHMASWIQWLEGAPTGSLGSMSEELQAMWVAWRFAEVLVQKNAIVPQLLKAGRDQYVMRWLPALLQPEVAETYRKFEAFVPPYIVNIAVGNALHLPTPSDRAVALLSAFIGHFVAEGHDLSIPPGDAVSQLFFTGKTTAFSRFENREYPASIAQWINRFFLTDKSLVPVLEISETDCFEVGLYIEDRTQPLKAPEPLARVLEDPGFVDRRTALLRDLSVLADYFTDIRRLLAAGGKEPLRYDLEAFAGILTETLPAIRLLGIKVSLPKSLSRLLRPRASLRMEDSAGKVLSGNGLDLKSMLAYQWQVAVGDAHLSVEEFLKMLENSRGLVKWRDEYVYINEQEARALVAKLSKPPTLTAAQALQTALTEEYEGVRVASNAELRDAIRRWLDVDLLPLPSGLQAQLRPYQHRGYSWLCKNASLGFGCLLADDMGLGKTLQTIAALLHLKETGHLSPERPALVVVPTTLITNWEREVARFAPSLTIAVYHGPNRALAQADLVITSYGVARSDTAMLGKKTWGAVVVDEAQNIKNPSAEQTKAVKKIQAPTRIALSGTPVENRLSEFWSLFDFVNKGYLGSPQAFKAQYGIPIEGARDHAAMRRFQKITAPFLLRRLKTDKTVIADLPDKIEQNQFCRLTPEQASLYQGAVDAAMEKIATLSGIERRGLVLQLMLTLKQICNHPAQYLKQGLAESGQSGKCPLLLDLLGEALANGEKTLVFTQFREMGELLVPMIRQRFGIDPPFLHGGVKRDRRDEMVGAFQTQPSTPILLLSLKAGGTGLNLTAASQVIHFDLWWNPAVEAQATDRAYRIGQKRNVQVHRFLTSDTFEERINLMIQKKKELADLSVASGETWIGDLSDRELRALFARG